MKSLSNILALNKPGKGDLDWDGDVNANFDKLEEFLWQKMISVPHSLVAGVRYEGAVGANLLPGQAYFYKVSALNEFGETPASPEVMVAMPGVAHPVRLVWQPVVGATGYRIYKSGVTNGETLLATLGVVGTFDDDGSLAVGMVTPPANNSTVVLTKADTVDGFHASKTPGGGQIPVLSDDVKYPSGNGANLFGLNADTAVLADKVDGIHASLVPAANMLVPMDAAGKYQAADGSQIQNLTIYAPIRWLLQGDAMVAAKLVQTLLDMDCHIKEVNLSADTLPTGNGGEGLELDIKINGASIFSTKPKFLNGSVKTGAYPNGYVGGYGKADTVNAVSTSTNLTYGANIGKIDAAKNAVVKGSKASCDITQIGSVIAGGDITVTIVLGA